MKNFFAGCIVLSVLLWLSCQFLVFLNTLKAAPTLAPEIVLFTAITTTFLYIYLYRAKTEYFVQLYLLTMVIKLFVYCAFSVFIILQDRIGAAANVGFFLISYLLFTTLELMFLYAKINR